MENVLKLVGIIIMAIAVVLIYDARKLAKKFFSKSDINDVTKIAKLVGFIAFIIGGVIVIVSLLIKS